MELLVFGEAGVRGVRLGTEGTLVPRGGAGRRLLHSLAVAGASSTGSSGAGHAAGRREVLRSRRGRGGAQEQAV